MRTSMKVKLNKITDAKRFIGIASQFDSDIDISSDHYIVDAKSILGIFALDLSKSVEVSINSDDEEEIRIFNEKMEEFIV